MGWILGTEIVQSGEQQLVVTDTRLEARFMWASATNVLNISNHLKIIVASDDLIQWTND